MSRSVHHNTNTSIGDFYVFRMETEQAGDIKLITDNGFQFTKPVKCEVYIIDNFRIIKHEEKLVIQKSAGGGVFNTLFAIE